MARVTVRVLGGGQEVGRSAILLEMAERRVMLDYGAMLSEEEGGPQFPLTYPPKLIDALVITHAHLDHSGAAPVLYVSVAPPLYTTSMTLSLSEILIRDFLKVSGYYLPYEFEEFKRMRESAVIVRYGEEVQLGSLTLRFTNAGHIPGSASVMVSSGDASVLYTGDYNTNATCLLSPARLSVKEADIIITEGTYAAFDHPSREAVEREFVERAREVIENGGKVLVPAFAVGRAQEIMCVLARHGFEHPVYVDGMARTVSDALLAESHFLRDPALFERAYRMARMVRGWDERREVLRRPCLIISPAGMLKGGASVYYLERINREDGNAVFFVSYQSRGTPGREILEEGTYTGKGRPIRVRARVHWFDFSSHCGKRDLRRVLREADPAAKVVIVHAERETGELLKRFCERELGLEAYFPKVGEELELRVG